MQQQHTATIQQMQQVATTIIQQLQQFSVGLQQVQPLVPGPQAQAQVVAPVHRRRRRGERRRVRILSSSDENQ
jgi:hypothetical protein